MMKNLFVFFILGLSIISCGHKEIVRANNDNDCDSILCVFVNKSGVEVAIVATYRYGSRIDFPDSLVLPDGQEYSWKHYRSKTKNTPVIYPKIPLGDIQEIKLYFDKKIEVETFYKNLFSLEVYEEDLVQETYKQSWTYTFPEEDYLWALEKNKQTE